MDKAKADTGIDEISTKFATSRQQNPKGSKKKSDEANSGYSKGPKDTSKSENLMKELGPDGYREFMNMFFRDVMVAHGPEEIVPGGRGHDKCGGCLADARTKTLRRCAKCKKTAYCSAECQEWHYKEHNLECNDEPKVLDIDSGFMSKGGIYAGTQCAMGLTS